MNNSMLLGKYLQIMITYKYCYRTIALVASFFSFSFAITFPEHEYLTESIKTISLKKLGTAKHVHLKNEIVKKNLVLLFINHKNFESQKIISEIQNIRASIQNSKIEYFLISHNDNDLALLSMAQKHVWTVPVLIDEYKIAASIFNIKSLPYIIVLKKDNANISFKTDFSETGILDLINHIKSL